MFHKGRFRHIKIKYHFIRQLINDGWCKLVKVNMKEQIADMATQILNSSTIEKISKVVLGNYDEMK
jgi:hypothetical protein